MISPNNLTLMRKIWSDIDSHDYSNVRAAYLHEIERILDKAREEGRHEMMKPRAKVRTVR